MENGKGEGNVTEKQTNKKQKLILANVLAFVYEKAYRLKGKEIEMVESFMLYKRWSISFSMGVNNK